MNSTQPRTPERGARRLGFEHCEAYCLMLYRTEDGSEEEWIWNSRDGVSPFIISSKTGAEMQHVDWQLDRCEPNHRPAVGDRIFVTTTVDICRARRQRYVEQRWGHNIGLYGNMADRFASKDEAVEQLARADCEPPGRPTLVEVTLELQAVLAQHKRPMRGPRWQPRRFA